MAKKKKGSNRERGKGNRERRPSRSTDPQASGPEMIKLGIQFFGLDICFASSGNRDIDQAAKTVFYDKIMSTRPLTIATRLDCRIMLAWSQTGKVPRTTK